jgi:hypothetical protein
VAKIRKMLHEVGGLKMVFTTEIANGLLLSWLQRLWQQGRARDNNKSLLLK